jgi:hypothetical protein
MGPVEVSRTLVLDALRRTWRFFEVVVADNIDIARKMTREPAVSWILNPGTDLRDRLPL